MRPPTTPRAPGGATLGALELHASLREAQADVARLRGEVLALGAEAEAGARERAGLQVALDEARSRWGLGKGRMRVGGGRSELVGCVCVEGTWRLSLRNDGCKCGGV